MPYVSFASRCPELARAETRSVTVLPEAHDTDLPPGTYTFVELFCEERGCDCRRVLLFVEASFRPGPEAVIAWGWEPREYYEHWSHESDPLAIDQLKGPALNLGSPETELAHPLLRLATRTLLSDPAYTDRLQRHYQLFRDSLARPRPGTAWFAPAGPLRGARKRGPQRRPR